MKTGTPSKCEHRYAIDPAKGCAYCGEPHPATKLETSLKEAARAWSRDNTVRMNTTLSSHQAHCEAFTAGAKWARELAAKAVENAKPSHNRNDLAETIRRLGMSGDTGP